MANDAIKSNWQRFQFSLRWLLALTTVVGIGLTFYRWPWTTERIATGDPYERPAVVITTWRRGWNGKPEKHGYELAVELEMHRGTESRYVNGELLQGRVFVNGRLERVQNFRDGVATDIPAQPRQEDIQGVWVSSRQFGDETVTQRCPWRNAERHGLSTWTSSTGRLLQSAEFECGRIVKWNGEPVAAALLKWIEQHVTDEVFRQTLLSTVKSENDFHSWPCSGSGRAYLWSSDGGLMVCYGFRKDRFDGPTPWLARYKDRMLGEVLVEMALGESGTLDHRFGAPCVVPICTSELEWGDPTDISSVKFPERSPEQHDWEHAKSSDYLLTGWPAAQLNSLCEMTALHIDTTTVDHLDQPPSTRPVPFSIPEYPRPLRHVFGHILYDAGYRCEQRADVIVVLPGTKP